MRPTKDLLNALTPDHVWVVLNEKAYRHGIATGGLTTTYYGAHPLGRDLHVKRIQGYDTRRPGKYTWVVIDKSRPAVVETMDFDMWYQEKLQERR